MGNRKANLKHLFMVACLLVVGFVASGPMATTTEAAVGGCRADPLVVLSNGTILDVTADIGTSVSNVTEIHYVIHGPRGVKLVAAIRTPTLGLKGPETFTYYADSKPNQYILESLVRTKINHVGVTMRTTFLKASLQSGVQLTLQYQPVTGFNNQLLRIVIQR